MELKINGDLSFFWQWDLDRKVIVEDNGVCSQVHFCSGAGRALVCDVTTDDEGNRVANVPNILLQKPIPVKAYLYTTAADGTRTRSVHLFDVRPRPRPEDYVYTETEVRTYEALDERIKALEQNDIHDVDLTGYATEKWVEEGYQPKGDYLSAVSLSPNSLVYINSVGRAIPLKIGYGLKIKNGVLVTVSTDNETTSTLGEAVLGNMILGV